MSSRSVAVALNVVGVSTATDSAIPGDAKSAAVPVGTGAPLQSEVVNPLTVDGQRYLVAPRGTTQWVRNLRAAGQGTLRVGRRVEEFTFRELGDDEKPGILRAYLKRWKFEVGVFFDGVGPDSSEDELRRIAPDHPVFRLTLS